MRRAMNSMIWGTCSVTRGMWSGIPSPSAETSSRYHSVASLARSALAFGAAR